MQISRVNYGMNSVSTSRCQQSPVAFGNGKTEIPVKLLERLTPNADIGFKLKGLTADDVFGIPFDSNSRLFVRRKPYQSFDGKTGEIMVGIESFSPSTSLHHTGIEFQLSRPSGVLNQTQAVSGVNKFMGLGFISNLSGRTHSGIDPGNSQAAKEGLIPLLQRLLGVSG